jgi:ABC-type cobalamin transport system permease subunit
MWTWIQFWLSVALIPLDIWLHHQVPPFRRYDKLPAEIAVAGVLGIAVIGGRLVLQMAPVWQVGRGPPAIDVPAFAWLAITVAAFVVIEIALLVLYIAWVGSFTGSRIPLSAARLLGPAYFLGIVVESVMIWTFLRMSDNAG